MEISRPIYPTANEAHILCNMGGQVAGKSGRKIHLYPQKQHSGNTSKRRRCSVNYTLKTSFL